MSEERNYWLKQRTTQRISRRGMLRGAALGTAGLAGAVLIGCGDSDDATATATATPDGGGGGGSAATATAAPTEAPAASMDPVQGEILSGVSANVYETVDGHQTVASPVLTVLLRAQSKLLRFSNPNLGELTGDLAESWEQVSPTEIILNMRQGVTFHDAGPGADHVASTPGRDFTTDDVVYNIERQKAGLLVNGDDGAFGRKSFWSKVANLEATGREIKVELTSPDATFIQGLANEFNVFAQPELIEAVESEATDISADKVIGTGPYIITEWRPGERLSGVRNPNYYDPDFPRFDGFVFGQAFEDPTAYRIGFEQKQVDSFSDPDPDTTIAIQSDKADETYINWSGVANTVAAYTNTNIEPFSDLRLAQAIDLTLDRRLLIQQLHNGFGRVSGPVSWMQQSWAIPQEQLEVTPGYRSGAEREEDIVEANKLWQAAGGADVGEIKFVIADTWSSRASWTITPELIAGMFNEAFVTSQFKGDTASYGEIIPSWFDKTFDNFFAWIPNIEIPDARADMVGAFGSDSPANLWSVNEPDQIDAKLEQAIQSLDYDEAFALMTEVQEFILSQGQFGRHIAYNYIAPGLAWNYYHRTGPAENEAWNFLSTSLGALDDWIDPNDPSFEGRSSQTPTPV